jgi:hypothetical protein
MIGHLDVRSMGTKDRVAAESKEATTMARSMGE